MTIVRRLHGLHLGRESFVLEDLGGTPLWAGRDEMTSHATLPTTWFSPVMMTG